MADHFAVSEVARRLAADRHDFAEFFRAPSGSLSLTIARWPAGSVDEQQPHTEDEVYYVWTGRAVLLIGDDRMAVGPVRWRSSLRASSIGSARSPTISRRSSSGRRRG